MDADTQAGMIEQRAASLVWALEVCGHEQGHEKIPTAELWADVYRACMTLRARCDAVATAANELMLDPSKGKLELITPYRWSMDDVNGGEA